MAVVDGSRSKWLRRSAWFWLGLGTFVWLVTEWDGLWPPLLLAALWVGGSVGGGWARLIRRSGGGWLNWAILWLVGLLAGAVVPVATVTLMLAKTSLHDHPIPDYSLDDVKAVLSVWWVWGMGGALVGLAAAVRLQGSIGPEA